MRNALRVFNNRIWGGITTVWFTLMLIVVLVFPIIAATDLSSTVGVSGLTVSDNGEKAWSASAGGASWSGKTSESCVGTSTVKTPQSGELVLTNDSGSEMVLSFTCTFTNSKGNGTVKIDGAAVSSGYKFNKSLDYKQFVTISVQSAASTKDAETSVTLSNIKLEVQQVTTTFKPASANGSYAVDGVPVTASTEQKKESTHKYTLTATPQVNYQLEGWYFNGKKHSEVAKTLTDISFNEDTTVEVKFVVDPLYSIFQKDAELGGNIGEYINVDTVYVHNKLGSYHTTHGDLTVNNAYGPSYCFADPAWSVSGNAIVSGASGVAESDVATESGRCNAAAFLYSDIIRIQCLKSCVISFDATMAASSMDELEGNASGVYLYAWATDNAAGNAGSIMANGTALIDGHYESSGNCSAEIALNEGEYLYLYSWGSTMKSETQYLIFSGVFITDNYSYSSQLSNFVVSPAAASSTLEIGNYDNTGALLQSGSVIVNGTNTSLTTGNFNTTVQQGSTYTLHPGTAPAGYTFIGWDIDGERDYVNAECTLTLTTESVKVKALYVPAMTIAAAGTNGYGDATYTLGSNTYLTGQNPYYVARNAATTEFYYDLKTAFASTDVVVLLAGHTVNGDVVIPEEKALVVPYGLADDGITNDTPDQTDQTVSISNYCVLTVNGNLTVNGKLVVNGLQTGVSTLSGRPSGGIGCLVLNEPGVITVNGTLYAYGLVRSKIDVAPTAVVHELAEFTDRRGILAIKEIVGKTNDYKLMPFSHFNIESIEGEVTYNAGAKLYAHFSMLLEGNTVNTHGVATLIGDTESNGFLVLADGTLTKYYDFSTKQMVWRTNSGSSAYTGNMSFYFSYSYGGYSQDMTLNTQDFYFPLDQANALEVGGDFTFNSNFKFLPGSRLTVTESGHCTIKSGVDVVLYRKNDYDTRGTVDNVNYGGYSIVGFPVWGVTYPLGGYTGAFKGIADLESASLTVDGLMTVNGGLFVTNDLISETNQGIEKYVITEADGSTTEKDRKEYNQSFFVKYDNGYNILKGTGQIDVSEARSTTTEIYEAMSLAGSNTVAYDPVGVVTVKGLIPTAEANIPERYQSVSGVVKGVINKNGMNVWCSHVFTNSETCDNGCGALAPAAWINGSTITYYGTLADAVNSYNGSGYIQMNADTTESVVGDANAKKDIYLDLNGQVVTVTSFYVKNLYGMDTATNAFGQVAANQTYSYGSLNGTVDGTVLDHHQYRGTGKYYATSFDGKSSYSFHRFDLGVKNYSFYGSGNTGVLEFNMEVKGDALALAEIRKTGVNLSNGNNWYTTKETAYTGHISGLTTTADFTTPITVRAAIMMNDTASANTNGTVILGNRTGYFADGISFKTAMLAVMNDQNKAQFEQFATSNGFQLQ